MDEDLAQVPEDALHAAERFLNFFAQEESKVINEAIVQKQTIISREIEVLKQSEKTKVSRCAVVRNAKEIVVIIKEDLNTNTAINEINVLQMMNHPNVIKLVAVLNRNSQLLMLLENGRAIHTLLPPNYQMREQIVKKYMKEVAMGLEYIHGLGYVHRDLKPANLVVSTNDVAKIIDFGGAVHLASLHRDSKIQYTTQYLAIAIEAMVLHGKYFTITYSLDIWSFGCTLYELLTGKCAFSQISPHKKLNGSDIIKMYSETGIVYPVELSMNAKELIVSCLSSNPLLRPTASALLTTQFFNAEN